jgi:hypothetical protein
MFMLIAIVLSVYIVWVAVFGMFMLIAIVRFVQGGNEEGELR